MNIITIVYELSLVYRREFYNDSEIEPENSLMFKITLTPFGAIDSPTLANDKENIFFNTFLFFIFLNKSYANLENSIIVKIDNQIITNFEIKNKILTTLVLSNKR